MEEEELARECSFPGDGPTLSPNEDRPIQRSLKVLYEGDGPFVDLPRRSCMLTAQLVLKVHK